VSLEEEHVPPRKPTDEDVVETRDAGSSLAHSTVIIVHHWLRSARRYSSEGRVRVFALAQLLGLF
jgi:hypothetical protein